MTSVPALPGALSHVLYHIMIVAIHTPTPLLLYLFYRFPPTGDFGAYVQNVCALAMGSIRCPHVMLSHLIASIRSWFDLYQGTIHLRYVFIHPSEEGIIFRGGKSGGCLVWGG